MSPPSEWPHGAFSITRRTPSESYFTLFAVSFVGRANQGRAFVDYAGETCG
jgi:hypothetical protein